MSAKVLKNFRKQVRKKVESETKYTIEQMTAALKSKQRKILFWRSFVIGLVVTVALESVFIVILLSK